MAILLNLFIGQLMTDGEVDLKLHKFVRRTSDIVSLFRPLSLKLTFRKYPAIHTNYIISHCTTLQYNHNI